MTVFHFTILLRGRFSAESNLIVLSKKLKVVNLSTLLKPLSLEWVNHYTKRVFKDMVRMATDQQHKGMTAGNAATDYLHRGRKTPSIQYANPIADFRHSY